MEKALETLIIVLAFSVLFFKPTFIQNTDMRIYDDGLKVGLSRTAPPLAAITDELIQPLPVQAVIVKPLNRIWLSAVETQTDVFLASLEKTLPAPAVVAKTPRVVQLAGLTVTSEKPEAVKVGEATLSFKDRWLAHQKIKDYERDNFFETKSQSLARRVSQIQNFTDIAEKDYSQPTADDRVQEIVDQMENTETEPKSRWVGKIWVGKPGEQPKAKPRVRSRTVAENKQPPRTPRDSGAQSQPAKDGGGISTDTATLLPEPPAPEWPEYVTFIGTLTLTEGLAHLGSSHHLKVFRQFGGELIESAYIDKYNGEYRINVEGPEKGSLVAELRDDKGELIGREEILLAEHESLIKSSGEEVRLPLTVRPVEMGWEGEVYDHVEGLRLDADIEISEAQLSAKVSVKGSFGIKDLLHDSSFIARIKTKAFWKSLFVTSNVKDKKIALIPNKALRELRRLIHETQFRTDLGVIWGQVLVQGKPISGAMVELAREGAIGPIYFEDGSPTNTGERTSRDGYFAFANVNPGTHLIRATINGRTLPAKIILVESGFVTHINVEKSRKIRAEGLIYDSLTGEPLSSEMRFMGSEKVVTSETGYVGLKYFEGTDPLNFEVVPHEEGYYPIRVTTLRNRKSISFPIPSKAWIGRAIAGEKINQVPGTGVVVGYIKNSDFRIHLAESSINENTRLVYFNINGEVEPGADRGDSGGGFILFNLNPGLQTVMIAPEGAEKFATRLVVSDSTHISVMNHSF